MSFPLYLLMSTYSRLKNLIRDDIPLVESIEHSLTQQHTKEGWVGASFEPERMHRVLPFDFETAERINQWLEETLCQVVLKKRAERSERDKEILHLFRLLSIKFRIDHPYRGQKLPIHNELAITLESKICNCLMIYFDHEKIKEKLRGSSLEKPQHRVRSRS